MNIDSYKRISAAVCNAFFKIWENVREVYVKEYIIRKSAD